MITVTYEIVAQRGGSRIVRRVYWFDSEKERREAINFLKINYPEMYSKTSFSSFKVRGDT